MNVTRSLNKFFEENIFGRVKLIALRCDGTLWFAGCVLLHFPLTEILLLPSEIHHYNLHICLDVTKKYILKQFMLGISFSADVLFPEHLLCSTLFMILSFTDVRWFKRPQHICFIFLQTVMDIAKPEQESCF